MGNTTTKQTIEEKQIVAINLHENLLPKKYVKDLNTLIITDILINLNEDIDNLPLSLVNEKDIVNFINQLDLYSQYVSSISSIIAKYVSPIITNNLITNAMNKVQHNQSELDNFTNVIKTINPNINSDITIITNVNFINLISNIVQNNLDVISLKTCFLSHTKNFKTMIMFAVPSPGTIFQNLISNCTEISSQLSIIINNLLNKLNIRIVPVNTLKTNSEYIQELKNQYNNLNDEYNTLYSEITGTDFIPANDDREQLHKLHLLVKKYNNITKEMASIQYKINMLYELPFLTPNEIEQQILKSGGLNVSGNKALNININHLQQKNQYVDKIQSTNQNQNIQNDMSGNQNIDVNANIDITSNKKVTKNVIKTAPNKIFGIDVSSSVETFIMIVISLLLLISCVLSFFLIWRAKRTVKMVSTVKNIVSNNPLQQNTN